MQVVVSIYSLERLYDQLVQAHQYGDMIELRIDCLGFRDFKLLRSIHADIDIPIISTLRCASHGGKFSGSDTEHKDLLMNIIALGPNYLDIEYDCQWGSLCSSMISVIASYHNYICTPLCLDSCVSNMDRFPCLWKKIATTARCLDDVSRMVECVKSHRVVGMCMGERYGALTRELAGVIGAPCVYTYVDSYALVPGQVAACDLHTHYQCKRQSANTKLYGLVGAPIDKSIGYIVHNRMFREKSIDAVYVNIYVDSGDIDQLLRFLTVLGFGGISITMPLKESFVLDKRIIVEDQHAKNCGSVNTLVRHENGVWYGYNTDGKAMVDAVESAAFSIAKRSILIVGAGGVARSIACAFLEKGAVVSISNRSNKKGKQVSDACGVDYKELSSLSAEYDVVINATSIGFNAHLQRFPVSDDVIQSSLVVADVVTTPAHTLLLQLASQSGCECVHGYDMFARQAIRQLKIWLKCDFQYGKMLHYVREALA